SMRCCGPMTRRASCRTARRATATPKASRSGSPPPMRTPIALRCWCCSTARALRGSLITRAAATSSTAMMRRRLPRRGCAGRRPRPPAINWPIGSRPTASGRNVSPCRPTAVDRHAGHRYILGGFCRLRGNAMAVERTLSIIKPDATRRKLVDKINARFEQRGLRIIKKTEPRKLSRDEAERFYDVHSKRPFFNDLVKFMTSGPVVIQVLEGESAVALNREIMGATDPAKAAPGTIRKDFAESIEANSVHGADRDRFLLPGPVQPALIKRRHPPFHRGSPSQSVYAAGVDGRRLPGENANASQLHLLAWRPPPQEIASPNAADRPHRFSRSARGRTGGRHRPGGQPGCAAARRLGGRGHRGRHCRRSAGGGIRRADSLGAGRRRA